MKKEFTV